MLRILTFYYNISLSITLYYIGLD
ncbi:hypothetical protein CGLO_18442 [Colletotrichum gloeosporioides Cg-14]|uniref:Uncharacterized protein n=1 Tax=Colletotrichum gloeosporioides (strain Cg-14) TaxID=1237896 RepID=T0JUN9_COLGC|nr:hypothetical protein CGLO_18442 [Colletotrichum gloeosporioides Cg-14]